MLEQADLPDAVLRTSPRPDSPLRGQTLASRQRPARHRQGIAARQPEDVREQQKLIADAEGLVIVAPVFWMGFPAILKGWFERVFACGVAFTLTREAGIA